MTSRKAFKLKTFDEIRNGVTYEIKIFPTKRSSPSKLPSKVTIKHPTNVEDLVEDKVRNILNLFFCFDMINIKILSFLNVD